MEVESLRYVTILAASLVLGALTVRAEPHRDRWSVEGLRAPAQIIVDHWGVPHIFAASERDAYFLQGYNAARDRLWQIDLWRKRGLGLLSASFGPSYVAEDRAARLLLYRGDMGAEWAAYAPGMKDQVEAFVSGINAYVEEVRAGGKPLPVEFRLTDSSPDLWAPEDVVRIRSHALVANLTSEVARARVACAVGPGWRDADLLRRPVQPAHRIEIPKGLDPCLVTADVLHDYTLGTQAVAFSPERKAVAAVDLADLEALQAATGSNNWVVAASHTATGRPLVANDPHREIAAPSLRYLVHLNAPGLDLIGATEPATPGIAFGHNADAAFGLTIFGIDQEDLYVYDLNPADPDQYRYGEGWEAMRVVHETIPVKGEAPREIDLRFTRHGPVLKYDPAGGHAFALRTVWMQPGGAGYLQASWLAHARTWADFETAKAHYMAPPENLVWGDRGGDVGWAAFGLAPLRPGWDGLLPVPGDGRFEWAGFVPHGQMPELKNPPRGWFATANAYNLPADYPAATRPTAFEWSDPSRLTRIQEVLSANPHVSVADSMALQTDAHVAEARRLAAMIAGLQTADPRLAKALALLEAWDDDETTDSVAAAIYEVWTQKHLGRTVVAHEAPKAAEIIANGYLDGILARLEASSPPMVPAPTSLHHPPPDAASQTQAQRDAMLLESLSGALDELTERLGPDMSTWAWGRLHQSRQVPAAASLADPALKAKMTAGPLPIPGGPGSPKAATYNLQTFNVSAGASVRLVMDVGAWDNSMMVNTPGQSADPASPHYGDLFPLWAHGQYAPLLFSRPAIEAAADEVIELKPAS
jgi:penicillin amidase